MSARLRTALWLWYRGTHFRGWQLQPDVRTVQGELCSALLDRGVPARPGASGRTDRGVHARMQPASVRVSGDTDLEALARIGGADWGVAAALRAPPGFHAQWSAVHREYRYRLAVRAAPPRWRGWAWEVHTEPRLASRTVDLDLLASCLQRACGRRDFIAFHAASSVRKPRTLFRAALLPVEDGVLEVRLVGDAFGRQQARFLVGSAVAVAAGTLSEAAWSAALDRAEPLEGLRAPACGLTLWEVTYPERLDPFGQVRGSPPVPDAPPF